jgi:flagellar biosynthetic protein FlhB
MADDNKTERGSERRRRDAARERGQTARSRELGSTLSLLTAATVLFWTASGWLRGWRGVMNDSLSLAAKDMGPDTRLFQSAGTTVVIWVAPIVLTAWVLAISLQAIQGRWVMTVQPMALKLERLNPANNIKRLFSFGGLSRIGKTLLPFAFIAYLGISIMVRSWGQIAHLSFLGATNVLGYILHHFYELCWKSCGVLLIWAGVDVYLQKRGYEKSLKMTKQEVKDERKDDEGPPETKRRIRRMQRQMRRRWLAKVVPEATVVITNPTHFAVALRYDMDSMVAPVVVAKGQDKIAHEIRTIALWNGVPIIENRPLAQLLYRTVEEGAAIPAKLYQAVAEILAFVFKMKAERTRPPSGGGGKRN